MKPNFLKISFAWLVMYMSIGVNPIIAQTLFFERIFDETFAQASYVIGNTETKEAMVIDAKRDIDTYLEVARANGLEITHISETHIHADFLSGSRELASATDAKLYLSAEGGKDWRYAFPHIPLKDGDRIRLGTITLEVMHTPGHTPESITFLVNDGSANPVKAITGDFIFVGDVGRPDLLEKAVGYVGTQETGARQLYASINRFKTLPDDTEIWPGHGAGSFCGRSLSHIPQSTLRQEKLTNEALRFRDDEEGFIAYILEGQPEPPKYFAMMKRLNSISRPLLVEVPKYPKLSKSEMDRAMENGLQLIDARAKEEVAKGFIPGSIHIEGGKSFSTFVGSFLDYEQQLILIAEAEKIDELTRKLMRIGMDNVYGYISDVHDQSQQVRPSKIIEVGELKGHLASNAIRVIDVRTEAEYGSGHIQGAENIPLSALVEATGKLQKDKPVVIHCQSGVRAGIAYSILAAMGFDNILNYSGGINDWVARGNELVKEN